MKRNNKTPIVYQIYPKSFYDTDGDGHGDLKGIIEKLPYLHELGVDMLWLTPVYVSPQNDNGYDVANYIEIDPRYGTMADMEQLIANAKELGIGIMLDMVLNHTSTQHTWFQKALRDAHYRDYYFFKEKPTNWQSKFGGNAWQFVDALGMYYLHLFDTTQADLNWENPEVFQGICDIVNFWIQKGVEGFRFDVINLISKPADFEDDDHGDGRRYYTDGPKIREHLQALNHATFGKHPDLVTVGELSSTSIENAVAYATPENKMLSTVFNFHHLKVDYKDGDKWQLKPYDFIAFKKLYADWQHAMDQAGATMSLFLNNHDQPRSVSRFGDDMNFAYESATMLATSIQLMKGMPYIYQGEEIGLPNAHFDSIDAYRDIESLNMYRLLLEKKDAAHVLEILRERSRDNGRTPIPWDRTHAYGFTSATPWLSCSHHPHLLTVEDNLKADRSVFKYYQKLIQLRKHADIVEYGSIHFELLDHPELFVYTREWEGKCLTVVANYSNKRVEFDFTKYQNGEIYLSNYEVSSISGKICMDAFESIAIYRDK